MPGYPGCNVPEPPEPRPRAPLVVFLKNFVSAYTKRWLLILGGMYILTIMYGPKGALGALRDWGKRRAA